MKRSAKSKLFATSCAVLSLLNGHCSAPSYPSSGSNGQQYNPPPINQPSSNPSSSPGSNPDVSTGSLEECLFDRS